LQITYKLDVALQTLFTAMDVKVPWLKFERRAPSSKEDRFPEEEG